jgi:hypothetical protein
LGGFGCFFVCLGLVGLVWGGKGVEDAIGEVGESQACLVCCECVHVHAPQGARSSSPTQSTSLDPCHANAASQCACPTRMSQHVR